MHQYLDSDGSGTSGTCVSSTIGAERIADATTWLQNNGLKGFLGEIGAGSNGAHFLHYERSFSARDEPPSFLLADCISAVQGALCAMQQSGVWIGALWWAAGPWWGNVSSCKIQCWFRIIDTLSSSVLPID